MAKAKKDLPPESRHGGQAQENAEKGGRKMKQRALRKD
jgi:hypothetical protein